jgi:hypothetical protein
MSQEELLCSDCKGPMKETAANNAQLTLPDGRHFDCQDSPTCSQWSPEGVGPVRAISFSDLVRTHNPPLTTGGGRKS